MTAVQEIIERLEKEPEQVSGSLTKDQLEFYRAQLDRCWPWLKDALDHAGGTHDKEHLWDMIEHGDAQLWPTPNAAMLTSIERYPTGLIALRGWLSGGDLKEIQEWEPVIAAWAKNAGCQRVIICGRRGWLRAFKGYQERATVMTRDL